MSLRSALDLALRLSERTAVNGRCAVAIPVKDEADRLPRCLSALAAQRDKILGPLDPEFFRVFIFANNCADNSAELSMRARTPFLAASRWTKKAIFCRTHSIVAAPWKAHTRRCSRNFRPCSIPSNGILGLITRQYRAPASP
jgi:hypothetical protein